jgi:hypothetical protein
LALLAGGVSLGHSYLTERSVKDALGGEKVVVVTSAVAPYQKLKAASLALAEVPRALVLPGTSAR